MPRISPREVLAARSAANKALSALLPSCRDLRSARNEFKWMAEHALNISQQLKGEEFVPHSRILSDYVHRRASGEPLQYILGSEYFGELEIKCRPGVLIPRQETAASVTHLAHLLRNSKSPLRVLDLCTGTGCILLLFHDEFYSHQTSEATSHPSLDLLGVDISSTALSLARENLVHQIANQVRNDLSSQQRIRSLHKIGFIQADIFQTEESFLPALESLSPHYGEGLPPSFDILISNPPYISPTAHLPRSVRLYEPELALIPGESSSSDSIRGDEFYPVLLRTSELVNAKVILFEVGDLEQAKRVAEMAVEQGSWERIEIWRDCPLGSSTESLQIAGQMIHVCGEGNGRSVLAVRGDATKWIKERSKED